MTLFGTDGIRDVFGQGHLTGASILKIGAAVVGYLRQNAESTVGQIKVLIGRDTRTSGPVIEQLLRYVFQREDIGSDSCGICPTPTVSLLTDRGPYSLGVVISASHNPPEFNGIKLFDSAGRKLTLEDEGLIETLYANLSEPALPEESELPREELNPSFVEEYTRLLTGGRENWLSGMKVLADCARGATSSCARQVLEGAGAVVEVVNETLDGSEINVACGSLSPEGLAPTILSRDYDFGVAFDGDGDRAVFVDNRGEVVDGDEVMGLWALDLKRVGRLKPEVLVATDMSNAGLESHLREHGIEMLRTPVGDREVYLELERRAASLGGEQSGHIIYRPEAKTGDGLRTCLHLGRLIQESGKSLSELRAEIPRFPQTLIGVEVKRKVPFAELAAVQAVIDDVSQLLSGRGRLLVRYSGTEPLARVLVEGADSDENSRLANRVGEAIRNCKELYQ